jgi:hypothetical protein
MQSIYRQALHHPRKCLGRYIRTCLYYRNYSAVQIVFVLVSQCVRVCARVSRGTLSGVCEGVADEAEGGRGGGQVHLKLLPCGASSVAAGESHDSPTIQNILLVDWLAGLGWLSERLNLLGRC